jgi:hypothetical protein
MQIADSRRQIAATTGVFSVKSMQNADFRFFSILPRRGLRGSLQNADCNGADCNFHLLNSPLPEGGILDGGKAGGDGAGGSEGSDGGAIRMLQNTRWRAGKGRIACLEP